MPQEPRRRRRIRAGTWPPRVGDAAGDRLARAGEESRDRVETPGKRPDALCCRRERAGDQRHHAEHSLASASDGLPRWKWKLSASAICTSRNEIASSTVARRHVAHRRAGHRGAFERGAEGSHLVHRRRQPFRRPVGQPVVVIVHARERRVDGPKAVVAFEEAVERGHHASGSGTHRRSRNDRSTALMTS